MISAFGVDHGGEISKINVKPFMGNLAPMGRLARENTGRVGAGSGVGSKQLGQGMRGGGPANYPLARKEAKKAGQMTARRLAQGGSAKSQAWNSASASANLGWQKKASAWASLPKSGGAAPAGMRGSIKSRANTSAMQRERKAFI